MTESTIFFSTTKSVSSLFTIANLPVLEARSTILWMISSLDLGDVAMEKHCICSKLLRYIIIHKKKKKENKKVWLSIIRAKMLSNPFLIIIILSHQKISASKKWACHHDSGFLTFFTLFPNLDLSAIYF